MTATITPPIRLSVIIFPHEGRYAASCFETCTVSVKDTPDEAAAGITKLLDTLLDSVVSDELPLDRLLHPAPSTDFERYAEGIPFQHEPSLTPKVQSLVSGIEYHLSPYPI